MKNKKPYIRIVLKLAACLCVITVSPSVFAQTTEWTGAVDDEWFDNGNWTSFVPNASIGASIIIPDTVNLSLGNAAADSLSLANGANLNVGGTFTSVLDIGNILNIAAELNVESGTAAAQVNSDVIIIGQNASDTGVLTLRDIFARVSSANYTRVGDHGTGTVNVSNGAEFVSDNGAEFVSDDLDVGFGANSFGYINVSQGGILTLLNDIHVGNLGDGSLVLQSNSTASTAGNAVIGSESTGVGEVEIDNSSWSIAGDLEVGKHGEGSLLLFGLGGGQVDSATGVIGAEASGSGQVDMTSSSSWLNSGTLVVGGAGE